MLPINTSISMLIGFQIRWRAHSMSIALMRYKLFIVFALLMLASSLQSLQQMLLFPVSSLMQTSNDFAGVFLSIILYQSLGLIWFAINQAIQINPQWERYFSSLPLSRKHLLLTDLCVLFVWNALLWLPLLFGALQALNINSNFMEFYLVVCKCLFSINFVLLTQYALKNKCISILGITFIFNFIAASFSVFPASGFGGILIVLVFCSAPCYIACLKSNSKSWLTKLTFNYQLNFLIPARPSSKFAKIQFTHLFYRHFLLTNLQTCFLILLTMAGILLIYYNAAEFKALMIASIFSLLNTLIVSHLFVRLYNDRSQYSAYLNALPLRPSTIFIDDLIIASGMLLPCNFFLLFFTHYANSAAWLPVIINTLIMPYCFLSLSYYPQIIFKKYGFFIVFFIMTLLIWFNYFLNLFLSNNL